MATKYVISGKVCFLVDKLLYAHYGEADYASDFLVARRRRWEPRHIEMEIESDHLCVGRTKAGSTIPDRLMLESTTE